MRILITGGHLTPAIALIQKLQQTGDHSAIVSAHFSSRQSGIQALEPQIATQFGLTHYYLTGCKWHRHLGIPGLLAALPACFLAFFQSLKIILNYRPDVIVSFGGYIGLPICFAGFLLGKPILLHEQTSKAGLANRLTAYFARQVAISFKQSQGFFPTTKIVYTGNLIRAEFKSDTHLNKPQWLSKLSSKPIIYITAGNQGSLAINHVISQVLPQLVTGYTVIHQVGRSQAKKPLLSATRSHQKLPRQYHQSYFYRPWFSTLEAAWLLRHAHIIISRSGANTVWEIIHTHAVSLLIPLENSAANEQLQNAKILADPRAAILLPQTQLTPASLLQSINNLEAHYSDFQHAIKALASDFPQNSVNKFYQLLKRTAMP